jgi:hypothetical protein
MPAPKKYANSAQRQAAYRSRCKERTEPPQTALATGAAYRRWEKMRKQALDLLNQVAAEMEIYHDQRSETWQESERAEEFNELMESISDTAEALADIS